MSAFPLLAALLFVGACDESALPPASSAGQPPSTGPLPGARALPSAGADEPTLIAFVGAGTDDALWPVLKASAERYAATSGTVRIRYDNPPLRTPRAQTECLRSLDDPQLRGLCVQIMDADAVQPALREIFNRGIVIVSMIQPIPKDLRVGHVGLDDAEIGKALAEATVSALADGGSMALLHAGYEHPLYGPRRIAFEEAIRLRPQIEIFTKQDCRARPAQAREIIRSYSKRFPRLSAWVALDDWPLQDREPTEDLGIPAGCRFITFGGTPAQWPLIEKGISPAVVAADYGELGAIAVQYCEAALREPSRFERLYKAPLRTIGPADLDAYKRDWHRWSTSQPPPGEP